MVTYSQKSLVGRVKREIEKNRLILSGERVVVAVSGGADSVCLLYVLNQLRKQLNFTIAACHYNHRLRGKESDADEQFVQKICDDWGIELFRGSAEKPGHLKSEEAARNARYAFFEKIAGESRGIKIVLAHNSNDLAETLVLRMIRGTGLRGASGIPLSRDFYIRPLLSVTRSDIEQFLQDEGIAYRVDSTNMSLDYTRNFVRAEILPQMQKINPRVIESMSVMARSFEDDYALISRLTELSFREVAERNEEVVVLDRNRWLELHSSLKRSVLRSAVERIVGLTDITVKQLEEVMEILKRGVGGKMTRLPHSLRVELRDGKIVFVKEH